MGCGTSNGKTKGRKIVMMGLDGSGKTTLLY
jgi:GTPase SAR1 family protein